MFGFFRPQQLAQWQQCNARVRSEGSGSGDQAEPPWEAEGSARAEKGRAESQRTVLVCLPFCPPSHGLKAPLRLLYSSVMMAQFPCHKHCMSGSAKPHPSDAAASVSMLWISVLPQPGAVSRGACAARLCYLWSDLRLQGRPKRKPAGFPTGLLSPVQPSIQTKSERPPGSLFRQPSPQSHLRGKPGETKASGGGAGWSHADRTVFLQAGRS